MAMVLALIPTLAKAWDVSPKHLFGEAVKVYAYTPHKCSGQGTASGEQPRVGTVAVSRDLFKRGWTFGKRIRVGSEILVITDLMHPRHRRSLDKWHPSRKFAADWGVRKMDAVLLDHHEVASR